VKINGQSPLTRGLLKAAKVQFRVGVAIEDGFPDSSAAVDLAKSSFLGAVTNANAPRRGLRFKQQGEYMTLTIAIVCSSKKIGCFSLWRLFFHSTGSTVPITITRSNEDKSSVDGP
jgi:hypothetical protein